MDEILSSRLREALAAGTPTKPLSVMIVLPETGTVTVPEVSEFITKRGGAVEFEARLTRSIAATMPAQGVLELTQKYKDATVTIDESGELEK